MSVVEHLDRGRAGYGATGLNVVANGGATETSGALGIADGESVSLGAIGGENGGGGVAGGGFVGLGTAIPVYWAAKNDCELLDIAGVVKRGVWPKM